MTEEEKEFDDCLAHDMFIDDPDLLAFWDEGGYNPLYDIEDLCDD